MTKYFFIVFLAHLSRRFVCIKVALCIKTSTGGNICDIIDILMNFLLFEYECINRSKMDGWRDGRIDR